MASETARIRARHQSLQRRRKGLKKADELAVYCGVDLCIISYGPEDDRPDAWPENPSTVRSVIRRFDEARKTGKIKEMVGVGLRDCRKQENPLTPTYSSWCAVLDECQEEESSELVNKLDELLLMLRGRIERLAVAAPSDSKRRKGHRNTL
ncbi:agamous-like MADS-box protein AGL82 [Musa acuminata AAA Group]|uniref:agamous-like MADS-box protein AGL82 n=1 Tax=Musa acuminata AAA Group TaxID=214697 RepID=UPI0031E47A83